LKQKKLFSILSGIVLSTLALVVVMNALSAPSVVQAQGRIPTPTSTKIPPRYTKTSLPSPTDTRAPRPKKTATPIPSPTFTNTPIPTSTSTPVSNKAYTPSPTNTAIAAAFSHSVRLNELLPHPELLDWNKDKVENANDQWIELYNLGDKPADVSNWIIDTGDQTPVFFIPRGSVIPAEGFLVFFRTDTLLNLDDYDHLRLLHPDYNIADEVLYPALEADRVYARAENGIGLWRTDCVPTPLTSNCQTLETASLQFNLPYFEKSIFMPTRNVDMQVLTTNILLALILALAIGFFSNLLNDAIESHEQDFAVLFGPLTRVMNKARDVAGSINKIITRSRFSQLGFILKFLVILLAYGTILAYLDPSFQFITRDSFLLIIALGLSTGLIALADDLVTYIYLRTRGTGGEIRFHSGNFLLVILSTFFSRVTGLVPGLLLGSPAGIEDVPDEYSGAHLDILAIITTGILGAIAWGLLSVFQSSPWLKTLLLLMFAASVQTIFFEMVPISYLHGKGIFKYNRILWLVLFAIATAAFLQTMLNPDGAFLSAFESTNMILLSLFVLAYCVFCALVWFSLTRLARKHEVENPPQTNANAE
jgi:hypothetical protein